MDWRKRFFLTCKLQILYNICQSQRRFSRIEVGSHMEIDRLVFRRCYGSQAGFIVRWIALILILYSSKMEVDYDE